MQVIQTKKACILFFDSMIYLRQNIKMNSAKLVINILQLENGEKVFRTIKEMFSLTLTNKLLSKLRGVKIRPFPHVEINN